MRPEWLPTTQGIVQVLDQLGTMLTWMLDSTDELLYGRLGYDAVIVLLATMRARLVRRGMQAHSSDSNARQSLSIWTGLHSAMHASHAHRLHLSMHAGEQCDGRAEVAGWQALRASQGQACR